MGWFWSDISPRVSAPPQPHVKKDATSPPAACPMNRGTTSSSSLPAQSDNSNKLPTSCPVQSPNHPLRYPNSTPVSPPNAQHSQSSTLSKLNPFNYIPASLSNTRDYAEQTTALPVDREISSIPRGDADSNWEYPSPQQMYNAMLRKGYTDTPSDAVESMVAVHNFLNEGAWEEILIWENIFRKGLGRGWEMCSRGEQGLMAQLQIDRMREMQMRRRAMELGVKPPAGSTGEGPKLLRFMGRPGDMTPKAKILQALGWAFPEKYGTEAPFDRHDWYVARKTPNGTTKEVRYVIDYYTGGVQETGEPVFFLDIRPALDSPTAAAERLMRWGGDFWYRASGASVRETEAKKA